MININVLTNEKFIRGCLTSYNEHIFESKLLQIFHVVCLVFESKLLHLFCLFNSHVDKWIPRLLLVVFYLFVFVFSCFPMCLNSFFVLNCHLSNSQHSGTKVFLAIEVHLLHMIVMGLDGSQVSGLFLGGTGLHFLCQISQCCQIFILRKLSQIQWIFENKSSKVDFKTKIFRNSHISIHGFKSRVPKTM